MHHCTNISHHGRTDPKIPQLHARPYYGHHRTSYCPALLWAPQDFVNRSYCPALLWAPQDFVHRTSESCNVPPHQPQYNNAM